MSFNRYLTRRDILRFTALVVVPVPFAALGCQSNAAPIRREKLGPPYQGTDDQLLDEIERASFEFFWNETNPFTGQIKDRALANGGGNETMSSIAATGFGLAAMCIADRRNYRKSAEIADRVRTTLKFVLNRLPHVHGFFYHFVNMNTGARWEKVELSSIDSSILFCGILMARRHFHDQEIQDLATEIYERVDWPWMLNGGSTFSMGWHPESGFLNSRWEHYCELMMIYLLAIGSPTHPVPAQTWKAWTRPMMNYQGVEYISGNDPLFTHQYSQAFFDFRNKRDDYADCFENSTKATKAHKLFSLSLHDRFPDYTEDLWGISASDFQGGYTAWGGPPAQGPIDGSIVPCATGGSLPFLFPDSMRVLRTIRGPYKQKAWAQYSFVDSFNPLTGWYDRDVLGIDVGITMLMAENYRTGFVWETFMKNAEAQSAMKKVGFRATA